MVLKIDHFGQSFVDMLRWRALDQPQKRVYTFLTDGNTAEEYLTYGELDYQARRFAALLQDNGVQVGERVLLLYQPGLAYTAAIFGCFYAGAVAVPAYPPRLNHNLTRIEAILDDADARVALTTDTVLSGLRRKFEQDSSIQRLRWIVADIDTIDTVVEHWHMPVVNGKTLALLQYTSGSTGTPKGVMVTHNNLMQNSVLQQESLEATSDTCCVSWLPPYHDMGLMSAILGIVCLGCSAVLMSPAAFLQQPMRWLQAISRFHATISGGPNFAYDLCVRKATPEAIAVLDLSHWKVAFTGSEQIQATTLEMFARTFAPSGFQRSALYPCYGMAEATLFISGGSRQEPPLIQRLDKAALGQGYAFPVEKVQGQSVQLVSCGRPRDTQRFLIVDPVGLTACGANQVGEIWVSTPNITQGYWHKPQETRETYQAYLKESNEGPFLRTGDLGFLADGELYVTGRLKDIIIIRGRNLYPQDIEAVVGTCHPALHAGNGAAFSLSVEETERLVVVQEVVRHYQKWDIQEIIQKIRQTIAREFEVEVYAIELVRVGGILKTSSGKIQHRACREGFLQQTLSAVHRWLWQSTPRLHLVSQGDTQEIQPENGTSSDDASAPSDVTYQDILTWLTMQIAKRAQIASDCIDPSLSLASFGLDSLEAMSLTGDLATWLGLQISPTLVYEMPTIEALAQSIISDMTQRSTDPGISTDILPIARDEALPLSFAQERLWFLDQLTPHNTAYNISAVIHLTGPLIISALEHSLLAMTQRHEILRTVFLEYQGQVMQHILPAVSVELPVYDVSDYQTSEHTDAVRQLILQETHLPFDLAHGPLLRSRLIRQSAQDHILLFTIHHIIADGWSMGILQQELSAYYNAEVNGTIVQLPALPIQYADFAHWQRRWLQDEVLQKLLDYWQRQLAGTPTMLELPTDRLRPAVQTSNGARQVLCIPAVLYNELNTLSQREGVTIFMTLLTAFQVLLMHYSGQQDILVGTPIANRTREELKGLIGFFVNTLVLRTNLSGNPTFQQLLTRVRDMALGAYRHQDLPFEQLVEILHVERSLSYSPVVQVLFTLQNFPLATLDLVGLSWQQMEIEQPMVKFDLTMEARETAEGLLCTMEYNTDLFDAITITHLLEHWQELLQDVVVRPERAVSDLRLLTEAETTLLQEALQAPEETYPEITLPELIEQQVKQTPDAVAIVCDEQTLTYKELNTRATRLASHLQIEGVGLESVVAVLLPRSAEYVIALLAILKAGGTYLPLDPHYPEQRLHFMLEDACVDVVLTTSTLLAASQSQAFHLLYLDQVSELGTFPTRGFLPQEIPLESLAYMIYTSGSTGTPKGVQVTHRGLCNLVNWHQRAFDLNAHDRTTQLASLSFDAAVWEIWPTLAMGATLSLVDKETRAVPQQLCNWLVRQEITVCFLPTPLAESLLETVWPSELKLRVVLTGGDVLHHAPRQTLPFVLVNNYGPTENSVVTTSGVVPFLSESFTMPSIGQPIANTQVYLLDKRQRLVPQGIAGELYIGGLGLARGYWQRAELTAERFVPHPFSTKPGARLYRTGDLARYRADGSLEFLGRIDQQVKLRGFRIEVGEIEACLQGQPGVEQAVVILHTPSGDDATQRMYLVAYLVPLIGVTLQVQELEAGLRKQLPDYMVPHTFILLDVMPVTSNGKLDRRALPNPDEQVVLHFQEPFVAPSTPIQKLIASIWMDLLHVSQIGIHDNFFELGGHSLLVTRVQAQVRLLLQIEISMRDLFEDPTIATLARRIEERQQEGRQENQPVLVLRGRPGVLPLSFAQERLWFLQQLEPLSSAYNLPVALRLQGPLQVAALEQSLQALMQRHEAMRTSFEEREGRPVQVIASASSLSIAVIDVQSMETRARELTMHCLIEQEAQRPFDLTTGPLLRACLLRLAEHDQVLLVNMHHIISDGWSMSVLIRELTAFYHAAVSQEPVQLPALPIQYADYAIWQRQWLEGKIREEQMAYWSKQLAGIAPLNLPTDHPRPVAQTYRGASQEVLLSQILIGNLQVLSQQAHVTLFMTLLASFQILLMRYSGQSNISIGTPIANRQNADIEGIIGFFVNTLVLRTDLSGNPSFVQVLQRVREVCLGAYAHQDLPFEQVVETLDSKRDLSRSPLFQVMLVLQNTPRELKGLPGVQVKPLNIKSNTSKFDLTLSLTEMAEGLHCVMEYSTDLFEAETIQRLFGHWQTLLEGIVARPDSPVSMLPLLTVEEHHLILQVWNQAQQEGSALTGLQTLLSEGEQQQALLECNSAEPLSAEPACIHEVIEAQAQRTPDAIAVVFRHDSLTYHELSRRSNHLASVLSSLGVGPNVCVGICLESSLDLPIGLLGVLKSGGVYVPLDPMYPKERLATIVEQAQISVLLTQKHLQSRVPESNAQIVYLDTDWEDIACNQEVCVSDRATPGDLIYVIYTSGSTGQPKGAGIYHRGFSNLMNWFLEAFKITDRDSLLLITSLSFDLTQKNIFAPLMVGGRLCLLPSGPYDPGIVRQIISEQKITLLNCTPSAFYPCIENPEEDSWARLASLRALFLGGESIAAQRLSPWLASATCHAEIVNTYGPTECTDVVAFHRLKHHACDLMSPIPIGRPIPHVQLLVLDEHLQLLPVGVIGELYIAGESIGAGYINDPVLTGANFLPNPFSERQGSCLYKTGDRVCYQIDGAIRFIERVDRQVKIRGFRIELREVEACLNAHPSISRGIVTVHKDANGSDMLVGYIIAAENADYAEKEIRRYLTTCLPVYMIPSAFVVVEAFPLTSNGKLDYQALPTPQRSHDEKQRMIIPPRTSVEKQLQRIWEEILEREPISIDDNFVELGGHSLQAIHLIAKVQQHFGKHISLSDLLYSGTLEALAAVIQESRQWSPLVRLSADAQNPNPPLFCAPTMGGDVTWYVDLARHLDPDIPVYGLQSPGAYGFQEPHRTLEAMAAYFVNALRTVQPEGPYMLAGYCHAGLTALEMARQLFAQGEQVSMLVFFDTTSFSPEMSFMLDDINYWMFTYPKYSSTLSRDHLLMLNEDEQIDYMLEYLQKKHRVFNYPHVRDSKKTHKYSTQAVARYMTNAQHMTQKYPGQIILFRTSERSSDASADPTLGWGDIARDGVAVYDIFGDHNSMMRPGKIESIAQQLKGYVFAHYP